VVWPGFYAAGDRWIGSEVLLHRTPPGVLDRSPSLDDAGDRCGPTIGRLPEGVSRQRARSLRGLPARRETPNLQARSPELPLRYGERDSEPNSLRSRASKRESVTVLGVIQEIDIWRAAVVMVKRYADDAEANADRRADELETEGDKAGAAIWRRVTVAIEQLIDRTGTLH